jgi:hypothetical protein
MTTPQDSGGNTASACQRSSVSGSGGISPEDVCVSCNGRRWKYVAPRRGLVVAPRDAPVALERFRQPCSSCAGTGLCSAA